jgi:hypothetical protein
MPPVEAETSSMEKSMSYAGLVGQVSAEFPHLGGSTTVGDPFTYCPSVWDYVISRFSISSVLDVGSGSGNAALYFHRKGLRTLAVEGLRASMDTSLYPAFHHDITQGAVHTRVDLVHCQEVVEHIEEKYLDHLIGTLLTGKIILMTHAVPGQGGHHHVNLQNSEYWIGQMMNAGCNLIVEDTNRIRELVLKDRATYMANTGMVFVNNNRA